MERTQGGLPRLGTVRALRRSRRESADFRKEVYANPTTGVYDITLRFVGAPIPIPGTRVERDANGEIIPPVINSRPTLTEAVESQLGLKLEPKTVTAKIFVVDHVEKVPLEN